ncbi:hypothetical protein KC973_00265 [Candidatus Saccharibacteria bacterium]|nr:hypothetical protein [Candidatus Saccharibacteria bacterium]
MGIVRFESFDTTLRDGAQALEEESHQFPVGSKPGIAEQLASLGVDVIEAGFPATPADTEEVQKVAQTVGQHMYRTARWVNGQFVDAYDRPVVIAGLSRTTPADIDTTWSAIHEARSPRIHTFISTDEAHMKAKFKDKTPAEVLDMGKRAIDLALEYASEHPNASVEFSAEASSTTDPAFLEIVARTAVENGVDVLNMPDTVGQRNPFWMYKFYRQIMNWVLPVNPDVTISAHCHNDLGHAVSNSTALVQAAADYAYENDQNVNVQVEGTICGLGERAGNADGIAVVAGLFKFSDESPVPITWMYNPNRAVRVARSVMQAANYEVPPKSPVVGSETNVHRSGIHSDGVIKGGFEIYTPHDPQFWGHETSAVHEEGRYQGKSGTQAAQSTR